MIVDSAAERIRAQARQARCRCQLAADLTDDGRCSRCFGRKSDLRAELQAASDALCARVRAEREKAA